MRKIPIVNGAKRCTGCQETKPLSEFSARSGKRIGQFESRCKKCGGQHAKDYRIVMGESGLVRRNIAYARRKAEMAPVIPFLPSMRINLIRGQKRCGACLKVKPHDAFSPLRKNDHALCSKCKECSAKHSNAWYLANSARATASNRVNILRKQAVLKLGARCANPYCLVPGGCVDLRALQIDHVNNDGAEERRLFGIGTGPKGGQLPLRRTQAAAIYQLALEDTKGRYQLLCANCNVIKEHERRQEKYRQRKEAHLAAS